MWKEEDSFAMPKYSTWSALRRYGSKLYDAENGIATSKCFHAFRDRFMQEGSHNHLYGIYKGKEIGVCLCNALCNRNTNTLVIGSCRDFSNNYLIPNLLKGHSSAVVVDLNAERILEKYGERFRENGYQTFLIDLQNADTIRKIYSNPEAIIENKPDISNVFDIKRLSPEKTYLFIKPSVGIVLSNILKPILNGLYQYSEEYVRTDNKRSDFEKNSQFLPRSVHFYLNGIHYSEVREMELINYLATDRPYGIGISCQTAYIEEITYNLDKPDSKYKDSETFFCCMDAMLFYGFRSTHMDGTLEFVKHILSVAIKPNGEPYTYKELMKEKTAISKLPRKCFLSDDEIMAIDGSNKMIYMERDIPAMILDRLEGWDYGD